MKVFVMRLIPDIARTTQSPALSSLMFGQDVISRSAHAQWPRWEDMFEVKVTHYQPILPAARQFGQGMKKQPELENKR